MNIFKLCICLLILLLFFLSEHKFNTSNQNFLNFFRKNAREITEISPEINFNIRNRKL